ncbi:GH92 family glycosyl hydrolase [Streptococcus acidominimus]|uniref:Alpha-mannosidase n=1 Tax=Streptococcus acidominimus TaxID=1326 RepID=A0A4Y9FQP4_STRAI|nr:GH92 family glycosyl hydrolase [Streptococcus acidominimus]MBF0818778.1 GH92 family glycosyl hydrolase [Streptococcus acidominimus]MBF0839445.1 GH92 family glycosyl hydrolase [Streptococcus acidominimus]MBF0847555.1 GH92 family glycosyl hydrolase [Streptococcus danieliae]TFU30823.1 alpha-mannosidase [Streptococcus acidominimus]
MKTILEQIDTRYGSNNCHAYSNGNTLPYTGLPFGMNYFVPQTTDNQGAWFFQPTIPLFQGIRLTHQASPWIGDYAWLLITPVTGEMIQSSLFHRQSSYRLNDATFNPHHLAIHSERYQIRTELTPTTYGACLKLNSLKQQELSLFLHNEKGCSFEQIDSYSLRGTVQDVTETTRRPIKLYIHLRFSSPITVVRQLDLDTVVTFAATDIEVQLGTSYISHDQALWNTPDLHFEDCKNQAKEKWNHYLHRFEISDSGGNDTRMFHHALYRTFLFPQTFYELDPKGQEIHLDLASNQVRPGKFFTNNGFWDTFRTSFPLFSLVAPEQYAAFLEGFLQMYRETGYLPKWLAPDERGMMPGTLIDGVIADACTKQIAPQLHEQLFSAMLETAQKTDPNKIFGRQGAAIYQQLGYLPYPQFHESVSHTLDYTYSDFCIATVAAALGQDSIAEEYRQQAQNYRQLFDPETGYFRAKDENGDWRPGFSPSSWGEDYAECSSIQASLGILHDIDGLKQVMDGEAAFTDYLVRLCNSQPFFEVTGYGYEIHEMSEMATQHFGQLAISNQPSFHIPYLFQKSLHPEYTSLIIKSICKESFQPGFDAYPGDEDNGSMSAWYIFSCLGFYPLCPGKNEYVCGVPHFPQLKIYLPTTDKWLTINSYDNHPHFNFVKSITLDGKPVTSLSHTDLLAATQLDFNLSWLPEIKI